MDPDGGRVIERVTALNYRALRYVSQPVGRFQILVGPNASGKSTFLDVVSLLGDILRAGPAKAILGDKRTGISRRAPDAKHVCWMREGDSFQLAVDLTIPEDRRVLLPNGNLTSCRYEVALGFRSGSDQVGLLSETFWLCPNAGAEEKPAQRELFPAPQLPPIGIVHAAGKRTPPGWKKVVTKVPESANDYFSSETSGWNQLFKLLPSKSALANLPEDEVKFPVAMWAKRTLMDGIQRIVLDSEAMRRPSAPGETRAFLPDGSNLPWVIDDLERKHPDRLAAWVEHLQVILPDLRSISTREREEDRHRHLVLGYTNGLEAPSWLVSDGTLRLLALTLLAYIPDLTGIYLIEEPENGIHPRAVEALFQSLSSVYRAQVLCATHSPVILSMARADQVLCFAKNEDGAVDIVRGTDHPKLKTWKGEVDLGTLFASGVLG